jgi:U2 small nuclear ribonucleoprotein B''
MAAANPPNPTLYINNLNDKLTKDELRTQLYALFTTYGRIIDIVASKDSKMRGQAFLVFADLASATSAMRACEGMVFYDKPLRINYAKSKSYATIKREDPSFIPPSLAIHSSALPNASASQKRPMDDSADDRLSKRGKQDDDSDEEMEIDDDDDKPVEPLPFSCEFAPAAVASLAYPSSPADTVPATVDHPTPRLLCTNLPQEVTTQVLAILIQQYVSPP